MKRTLWYYTPQTRKGGHGCAPEAIGIFYSFYDVAKVGTFATSSIWQTLLEITRTVRRSTLIDDLLKFEEQR